MLIETVGGHGTFAAAMGERLTLRMGTEPTRIPRRDPLAKSLTSPLYRADFAAGIGDPSRLRLRRLSTAGVPIWISHDDLSLGAMAVQQRGIRGYRPEIATQILAAWLDNSAAPAD